MQEKEAKAKLRAKMVELRKSGILPRGYAKVIADKLGVKESTVYNTTSGNGINHAVIDEVLKMAEENKIAKQLARIDKLLAEE